MAELRFSLSQSNSERLRTLISISREIKYCQKRARRCEEELSARKHTHIYIHNLVRSCSRRVHIPNFDRISFPISKSPREKVSSLHTAHISAVLEVNKFFESKLFLFDFLKGCHTKKKKYRNTLLSACVVHTHTKACDSYSHHSIQ
jgi:hypothetical protein